MSCAGGLVLPLGHISQGRSLSAAVGLWCAVFMRSHGHGDISEDWLLGLEGPSWGDRGQQWWQSKVLALWLPAAFSEACSSVLLRNTLRGEVLELSDCPLES